jgi:hypothetical protein
MEWATLQHLWMNGPTHKHLKRKGKQIYVSANRSAPHCLWNCKIEPELSKFLFLTRCL